MSVAFHYALRHRVAVRHGGTGEPLVAVDAELVEPAWPHWVVRRRGPDVLLSTYGEHEPGEPASTRVRIVVSDPALATRFQNGGVVEVNVPRATALVEQALTPVDTRIEVTLATAAGVPVTGKNVAVRATGGPTVALPEVGPAEPGVYRSPARQWGPTFRPARILVNGAIQTRRVTPDYSTDVTRVRLTVPA